MLTFLHAATAGHPVWLCEDVRRHIHAASKHVRCRRCGVVVSSGKRTDRIAMCTTPDGVLCFTCCHRRRWPKVERRADNEPRLTWWDGRRR